MFKKFRNSRNLSAPPAAPSAEEILSDLETFQVQQPVLKRRNNSGSNDDMDIWWNDFENFVESHKELQNMDSNISSTKHKLEKFRNELESTTLAMKKEISAQKQLAIVE